MRIESNDGMTTITMPIVKNIPNKVDFLEKKKWIACSLTKALSE